MKRALTDDQVRHCRYLYFETGCSFTHIAKRFKVSQATVIRAVDGKPPYTDIPYDKPTDVLQRM